MKILMFPQSLKVGGASLAAVELAGKLHRRGHHVTVYAPDGPLVARVRQLGLRYLRACRSGAELDRPSPRLVRELRRAVQASGADVVHTFEWGTAMHAVAGPWLLDGVPLLATFMSMTVPRFVPRGVPVTVGTRGLRDELVRRGFGSVALVVPPIDTGVDHPGFDVAEARRRLSLPLQVPVVAVVSRLAGLKQETVLRLIETAEVLGTERDLRILVVGDGCSAERLRAAGQAANARLGREIVVFCGELIDPGPAYAAADVVVGMGSSVLRAMAFAKPVVVTGPNGYAETFTPETSGEFVVQGFWGIGDGDEGSVRLAGQLRSLLDDPACREELGRYGRAFVVARHDTQIVADVLERALARAAHNRPSLAARQAAALDGWARFAALRAFYGARRVIRGGGAKPGVVAH